MYRKKKDKDKTSESYKVLSAVPYQLCPKCGGEGVVTKMNWYYEKTIASAETKTCDVCNGMKIIPMYVVQIEEQR